MEKQTKPREARSNQKLKLLYLLRILSESTDENHSITMKEIIDRLAGCNVTAERKSVYDDIEQLRSFGYDIIGEQLNRTYYYRLVGRQFELAELKLLVDAVQSSKFITSKKSTALIKKLETCVSTYEGRQLQRQVYVAGRIKTMNESIYYIVDEIHRAINENKKISFQYFNWTVDKEMEYRHGGARYLVSPWALLWDDDNYYLAAVDAKSGDKRHYRVDKMANVQVEEEKRDGEKIFRNVDFAEYSNKMFGMFDGEEQIVTLVCNNSLAGVMIDRFGKDVMLIKEDENYFRINIKVAVSRHFLSWIIALGPGARVISPENVVDQMKDEIRRLSNQYK